MMEMVNRVVVWMNMVELNLIELIMMEMELSTRESMKIPAKLA